MEATPAPQARVKIVPTRAGTGWKGRAERCQSAHCSRRASLCRGKHGREGDPSVFSGADNPPAASCGGAPGDAGCARPAHPRWQRRRNDPARSSPPSPRALRAMITEGGFEAAIQQYDDLTRNQSDAYDFREPELIAWDTCSQLHHHDCERRRSDDGAVVGLTLHQSGRNVPAKKIE